LIFLSEVCESFDVCIEFIFQLWLDLLIDDLMLTVVFAVCTVFQNAIFSFSDG
jgi:hypothetical protein